MQTKTIAYDKFEAKMLEIISAGTYEPDSEVRLAQGVVVGVHGTSVLDRRRRSSTHDHAARGLLLVP